MSSDFSKYVGIPFAFNESSFEAADCAGLASLFYREHGWTSQANYPKPKHKDWYITDQLYMQRWLVKNFDMSRDIEDIEFGDLLYFMINGEGHIGVALEYGKFLATYPKINDFNGGVSFIDRYKYWFNMRGVEFKAVFKRRCSQSEINGGEA